MENRLRHSYPAIPTCRQRTTQERIHLRVNIASAGRQIFSGDRRLLLYPLGVSLLRYEKVFLNTPIGITVRCIAACLRTIKSGEIVSSPSITLETYIIYPIAGYDARHLTGRRCPTALTDCRRNVRAAFHRHKSQRHRRRIGRAPEIYQSFAVFCTIGIWITAPLLVGTVHCAVGINSLVSPQTKTCIS